MASADVFIQAGHEDRTSGATGACGPLGCEIDWTPIVANEATRILREAGISVIRENAFLTGRYDVKVAIFIHFDGNNTPCSSGASVGYDDPTDKPAADEWKALYSKYWPYRWMGDNFTSNLRNYYGYRYTKTTDSEFVMELGELSCPEQAAWLKPRLKWLGALIAHFLSKRINQGNVPNPGPFNSSPQPSQTWSQFYEGITYQNSEIPRRDLINPTLARALGLSTEPLGTIVQYQNREFVQGKVSWFGGSEDRWVAEDETGTLTGEILRQLTSDDYYCAMRWNYKGSKQLWANRHLLIVNSDNNKAVIVRAIDWGPNTATGRILDVSRKTLDYLSAETDDLLLCAFANTDNASRQVGPVI